MKEVIIFGKPYKIVEQKTEKDSIEVIGDKIVVNRCEKPVKQLIREFLAEKLYDRLFEIYDEIKKEGKIEVLGEIDFEIVEKIDNRKKRLAKLKGNKIQVKLSAVVLPKPALKYVVAHEVAHIFSKKHTEKFWEITAKIYPQFKIGQKMLAEYEKTLEKPNF